jgi:DHA1 family bicyclomycin/chloramphenicol resistance-like MFS transporter
VLQDIYGLTPQQYALAFGLNSAGFMLFGYVGGRTSERWSVPGTLVVGLAMCAAGALGLLAGGLFPVPLTVVIGSLLVMVSGVAVTTPPTTTLALADHPRIAGTASSLLGTARFAFGAVSAPFVGIAGAATMLPLGIVTAVSVALAAGCTALAIRRTSAPAPAEPELVA